LKTKAKSNYSADSEKKKAASKASYSAANGLGKLSSGHVGPPFLAVKLFSRSLGPRAVPIESLLDIRCDLSHECAQDDWNDTCVKLEASKPS